MNSHRFLYHAAPHWAMRMVNNEPWYESFCWIVSPLLQMIQIPSDNDDEQIRAAFRAGVDHSRSQGSDLLQIDNGQIWIVIPDTPEVTMLILKEKPQ